MKRILISIIIAVFFSIILPAQQNTGVIKGRVYNSSTNEGVPFASIVVWGTPTGAMTDFDGNFLFTGLKPGFAELRVSSIGFKPYISASVMVTNSNQVNIDIPLEQTEISLNEVVE